MTVDRAKFKNMVHYVIWKYPDGGELDSTELNKVLWLSDSNFYLLHGKSISGADYIKEEFGLSPATILPIMEELRGEGAIEARRGRRSAAAHAGEAFLAKRAPDLSALTRDEVGAIDRVLASARGEHAAASAGDAVHDHLWRIAKLGETVPMYAVFAAWLREPNAEELAWAERELEGAQPPG